MVHRLHTSRASMGLLAACLGVALGASACDGRDGRDERGVDDEVSLGLALPAEAPAPVDNPSTPAKIELGRLLFWDPILSGDRGVACATCHHPDFAYADGRQLSVGIGGAGIGPGRRSSGQPHFTKRSSMTILDTAFSGAVTGRAADPSKAPMFWDSRASSLEQQARGPILAFEEMRGPAFDETRIFPELVTRLEQTPGYVTRFADAFGSEGVSETTIVRAIAAFERTLVARGSSYDRYEQGDAGALSPAATRGLSVWNRSGCGNCHSGPMFSDYQVHRIGAPDLPGVGRDPGAGNGGFRTPSLRNVTRTAPYMHSGAFATLDQVFAFYDRVDRRLDRRLDGVRAPERGEASDVKAFLAALSDGAIDRTIPTEVPSGLTPGGALR